MANKLVRLANSADISVPFTSAWVNLNDTPGWSLGLVFTGTPTGTLSIESTVDGFIENGVSTAQTSISDIAIAAAGFELVQDSLIGYTYVRFTYTPTGGAGTLDAWLTQKNVKNMGAA